MKHRIFAFVAGLLVMIGAATLLTFAESAQRPPSAVKAKTASSPASKVRRTPWGDPDLQGIWNIATSTPLQRPERVAGKTVLTDEEASEFQEELAQELNRDRRDGGPEADVNRAYNEHWMDARRLEIVKDKRTSLIVDPPDGRIPPLVPPTPEVQKKRADGAAAARRFAIGMPWGPEEMSNPVRCIVRTDRPPYLPTIYNNTYQIFQSPGYVAILAEMIHSARIIPLDGRPHLAPSLKQWLGDTRGRWDGDTLVIQTTNFRSDSTYGDANPATFKLTERFTRVDPNTIAYEFTVEDPTTWTRPWTALIPWNKTEDQLYEYACHEDNYDIVHLLMGARKREKAGETSGEGTPR
jgi:hypothetical protein